MENELQRAPRPLIRKRFRFLKNTNRIVIMFMTGFPLFVIVSITLGISYAAMAFAVGGFIVDFFRRSWPKLLDVINPFEAKDPVQLFRKIRLLYTVAFIDVAVFSALLLSTASGGRLVARLTFLSVALFTFLAFSVTGLVGWSSLTKLMSVRMANLGLRKVSESLPPPSHD